MPRFLYTVKDTTGKKITAVENSVSQDELVFRLQAKGMLVVNIETESKETREKFKLQAHKLKFKHMHLRITTGDLTLFCRQLATLLGAGVTILESLAIISKQVSSRRLTEVLFNLKKSMESGLSLHSAMAKERKIFSDLWINLVESGEASGNLAVVLSRLASYLERDAQFRSKIISALIYPVILMVVGLGALLFLTINIIPTFAELFENFNIELPLVTRMLIAVSGFICRYLFLLIGIVVVAVFVIRRYIKQPNGKKRYEDFLFNLPVMGSFFHSLVVERFSSELSTLIESGVPILYALEISERSVDNLVMAEIIHSIKEEVKQGRTLSSPMERSGFFEPMVVQMVSIGEEVGDLSGMFKKINAFYQEYVETFLSRFTSMFEPIMLLMMGVVVGVMVIGMFLPIFQISQIGSSG